MSLFAVRCNYYAVWKIAEAASIAAGFGLVQAASPAASNWDGVANVQPVWVELSWSLDEVIKIWNQHTQSWLGRYVFLRAPKSVGFYVTYFASAFWHGAGGAGTRTSAALPTHPPTHPLLPCPFPWHTPQASSRDTTSASSPSVRGGGAGNGGRGGGGGLWW